jgi:hypothetical protein
MAAIPRQKSGLLGSVTPSLGQSRVGELKLTPGRARILLGGQPEKVRFFPALARDDLNIRRYMPEKEGGAVLHEKGLQRSWQGVSG